MNDNSSNVHFSGVRFICSPYLAIKSALASLGPIMARCGPQMNLTPSKWTLLLYYHSWYPFWRYRAIKSLKNAEPAFFENSRAPYLQRDTGNVNNIQCWQYLYIFGSVFYWLSDGGIHFSIQRISFFRIFSLLVKPLEQRKTIAFYETLHNFRRLHPPYQKSPYMYLTVCGNKSFLATGLPQLDIWSTF